MVGNTAHNLDRIRLLASLSEAERRAVAARCRWHRYPAGTPIINHDSAANDVLLIVEGRVRVIGSPSYGREVVYAEIATGGHVGELAAVDGGLRSATVVTTTACLIAALLAADFRDLVVRHPSVALSLLQDFARIVRAADVRIAEVSTMGATERICRELLRSARPGATSGLLVIDTLPTQELIASVTGTTRETVAKVMAQLAHAGLVRRLHRRLEILDVQRVAALAGMDAGPAEGSPLDAAHGHGPHHPAMAGSQRGEL